MAARKNCKIANIQFILSILIVFIHSLSIFMNVPGEGFRSLYGPNAATYIQLFISEGICRAAIPLFMLIAGYLFYRSFDGSFKSYGSKLKRRFFSLVIPYLFWSTLVFLLFFFAQQFLGFGSFFESRNDTDLDLEYIFNNIVLDSYDSPLWFCRYLIVFAVLSIVLYWLIKKCPILVFAVILILWINYGNYFIPFIPYLRWDCVFFYYFGAIVALHNGFFIPMNLVLKKKAVVIIILMIYIVFLIIRTVIFCFQDEGYLLNGDSNKLIENTGKVNAVLGVLSFWYLYDYLIRNKEKIWSVSKYSFLLYAAHMPITEMTKKLIVGVIGYNQFTSLVTYFVTAAFTITMVLLFGKLIYRYVPWLWKIATGNR